MPVVRLEAMRALKAALVSAAALTPPLEVVTGYPTPDKKLCFPSLAIRGSRFSYHPEQAYLHREPDASSAVYRVGYHEAQIQLLLFTATPGERYAIEEKLIGAFLGTENHPGVLLTPVTAVTNLGTFLAAWELEEDEWRDELAFSSERGSLLTVTGAIPALVTRAGEYRVDVLQLGLTHDFVTAFDTNTLLPPGVEMVEVHEDGTISAI